jgi:hypothetical protein
MSINKLVSIENAILQIGEDLAPDLYSLRPTLYRWAIAAEKLVGIPYQYIDAVIALEVIESYKVELPLAVRRIHYVVLDDKTANYPFILDNTYFSYNQFNDAEGIILTYYWDDYQLKPYQLEFSVQNNWLISPIEIKNTYITVVYEKYETMADGTPLVNENSIQAIAIYLQLQLAMRERWKLASQGKLNNAYFNFIGQLKEEFRHACRYARSQADTTTTKEMAEYLNHPLAGNGTPGLA